MASTLAAPAPPEIVETAARFGLLADPLRLAIVQALAREQQCTCHLEELTGAKQTTVSHHLRVLREAGVVLAEPDGRFTWYRLAPGAFAEAMTALAGLSPVGEPPRLRLPCAPC